MKLAQSEDNWHDFAAYIEEKATGTVFKRGNIEEPIPFTSSIIDNTSVRKYPDAIKEFFLNEMGYRSFRASDNFVHIDETITALTELGAVFERYQPIHAIDIDKLKEMFPKTLPLLTAHNYAHQLSAEEVAHFAKMEEFYAIHSNDKRDSDTENI